MSHLLDCIALLDPVRRADLARNDALATLETRIAGIPCKVAVTHYLYQPPFNGSAWLCDCSSDYYGYTECEWEVLDQRGRPAAWLERKLSTKDRERIEAEAHRLMSEEA
jgi:hypothetical protein